MTRLRDYLTAKDYRELLLALEREGAIEVLDRHAVRVVDANARRPRQGKPTLGGDYVIPRRQVGWPHC